MGPVSPLPEPVTVIASAPVLTCGAAPWSAPVFGVEEVFEPSAVFWDVATLVCGAVDCPWPS